MPEQEGEGSLRVLLSPITRRDGEVTLELLGSAGVTCQICANLREMASELQQGAGALMLTDRALTDDQLPHLLAALGEQPAWSDVPVIILVREQQHAPPTQRVLGQFGNVNILDRPVSTRSMTSAVLSALRDRSKQYRIRDQLHRQELVERRLQEADRRKDEFLATLAHELRNPLAPIRAGLHVLAKYPGDASKAVDLVGMMERQMTLMVKLIDELLDLSRIATGKVVLTPQLVDLRDVIRGAVEGSVPAIDDAQHRLSVRLPSAPVWVLGDPTRLSQVLSNLLNNAAKYTPDGGVVELTLAVIDDQATVAITDSGVGIPADKLEEVFHMFSQVNRSLERSQGGLGIGLSLVRTLMRLHGGTITAESPGTDLGSTFTIRLPVADANVDARVAPAATSAPVRRRRVLIIDDNVDAADALVALAEADGHTAQARYTAQDGLAAAVAFSPDIVLCDIGMPRMNGYEVAKRLKQQPALAATLLVAVTGWGTEEDRDRAMQAGFHRHLTKPISYEEFVSLFSG